VKNVWFLIFSLKGTIQTNNRN